VAISVSPRKCPKKLQDFALAILEEENMVGSIVTTELAKIVLNKLAELKMEDASKVLEALGRSGRGALLIPGIGTLGLGIALGAGIGVLIAPRSGTETRAALRDLMRSKLTALRSKTRGAAVEDVDAREPNGQTPPANEPPSASN
jgi:hypothetical protein